MVSTSSGHLPQPWVPVYFKRRRRGALREGARLTLIGSRSQLPRAYPFDGLVKELSGTDEVIYAVSTLVPSHTGADPAASAADTRVTQARTESENVIEE